MKNKILAYGEIMLRLSPENFNTIEESDFFEACYGGSESNVLVALSHLGNDTEFFTKVPKNSLGEGVVRHLKKHGVGTDNIIMDGSVLGVYFMQQGFGTRPSKVIYNRKSAVINTLDPNNLNLAKIFKNVSWFHVSGISLAISLNSQQVTLKLLEYAKQNNIKTSFDFNFRSTLWSVEQAKSVYKKVMPFVDVCFGNVFDLTTFLDINENSNEKIVHKFLKKYNVSYLIHTNRDVLSATQNTLSASLYCLKNDKLKTITTPKTTFEILDRIGGGDAFVGGVIHCLNKKFNDFNEAINLGLKLDILKHLVKGDVLSLSKFEIESWINNNNKDVQR